MILSALLAATFTFTVTATGLEKGAPVEFLFAGRDTDRDYETMFVLDQSISAFCRAIEKAGLVPGTPQDYSRGILWPVGRRVTLEPPIDRFIERTESVGTTLGDTIIYTGGVRDEKGVPVANDQMPSALFALYSFAQSPILFNGLIDQGAAYHSNRAKMHLEKGEKVKFTIKFDEKPTYEERICRFEPGRAAEILTSLREASAQSELVVKATFSPDLTLGETRNIAQALATIDSPSVKLNGRAEDGFFYRAFLPTVKWLDRKERLTQPFELDLCGEQPKLVFIDEDWSVDGPDPKLTERTITFDQARAHTKTDTCFIYATDSTRIGDLTPYISRMPKTVVNWYVYGK